MGIETRKKLRSLAAGFTADPDPRKRWFFDPFVPDMVEQDGDARPWEEIATETLLRDQSLWTFQPGDAWHGFRNAAPGWAMTDPNKLTLITPGIDRTTGDYQDHGVPATVLAAYLRANGIVPEKCDLNSILFLMTPAMEPGKCASLIARLVAFKALHDADAPLAEVLPGTVARNPARYDGYGLRQLCDEMHTFYSGQNIKELQRLCFRAEHFPEQAMTVQQATEALVGNLVDYVPFAQVGGRVAGVLALIYPPGIGIVVPGERYDARAQPMIDYFLAFEDAFNHFPGFAYEVQGVYPETLDGRIAFHTYVVRENA